MGKQELNRSELFVSGFFRGAKPLVWWSFAASVAAGKILKAVVGKKIFEPPIINFFYLIKQVGHAMGSIAQVFFSILFLSFDENNF